MKKTLLSVLLAATLLPAAPQKPKLIVASVSDGQTKLIGGTGEGGSPHRMLVSTVGDELKMSNNGKSRVICISLKDRAAILPAGHMANGAFWFDLKAQSFVSSTYYFAD